MTDRRPGDWDLLRYDSDPVPYDPQDIRDEASDYQDVVTTIEDQIASLKRLADPDQRLLVGDYADKIQDAAEDLGDHLGKIKGRFDDVAEHLRSWAGTVSSTRFETSEALKDAVKAKADKEAEDAKADDGGGKDPDGPLPMPGTIPEELKPAIQRAETAMDHFDSEAGKIADKIRDASDDDMKDSRWDKFKNWVSGFADMLDLICDVLGWIAAAIVIAVLILSGPGGWLIFAAILGGLALLGHTLLAVTGNGSWLDVAFDAISLVTFGMGGRALKAANLGRQVVLKEAGEAAGKEAFENVMKQGLLNGGNGLLGRAHVFLRSFNPFRAGRATDAANAARTAWTSRIAPEAPIGFRAVAGGDRELGALLRELPDLANAARNLASPAALANLTSSLNTARNLSLAGLATDFGSLAMNPKLGEHELYDLPPHEWAEDQLTFTIGGPY